MSNKPKILYVDDEEINLHLFQINLNKHFEVIIANNGSKGLEILETNHEIKLIASDMKMPSMDGMEFIKKAKHIYPNLPFFLLTGFDITPQINEAINSQLIHAHLKKPFDIAEIQSTFHKALD
jgi:two-component system response regulator (stage 0 sporulation protein F)